MNSFFGLEIARRALFTSQKAIDVTGHNIANADTKGYTLQRVVTAAVDPDLGGTRFLPPARALVGCGVTVQNIEQVRNAYLDRQYRKENALKGEWEVKSQGLENIEMFFDESSGSSVTAAISRFIASLNELSKVPDGKEQRTNLLQSGLILTETINHAYSTLKTLQDEHNRAIKDTVTQINSLVKSIASLNEQIERFEIRGDRANDLRDQRNLLLDDLSKLINITAYENSGGHLVIEVSNKTMLEHNTYDLLEAEQAAYNPVTGANDLYNVVWSSSGEPVDVATGTFKGHLDLRDGEPIDNFGIPYLIENLNKLARTLAEEINSIHSSGYTLPHESNGYTSVTGINFFAIPTDGSGNEVPVTAQNISINEEIINNIFNIAASSVEIDGSYGTGNNHIVLDLISLFERNDIPEVGGFNTFYRGILAELGVETNYAKNKYEGQSALVDNIDYNRMSVSAVSIDEELSNLVKYQHSYAAAARMITAIDEALDILINKTGLVGR